MPSFIVAFLSVSVREHSTVFAFDFLSLVQRTFGQKSRPLTSLP